MSTTAVHGKSAYVGLEDPATPGSYIDISEKASNAGLPFSRDTAETSTFQQGDKTYLPGMRDATFSVDYYNDATLRDLLYDTWMTDATLSVRYGPEGDAVGKDRYTAEFILTGFGDNASIGGPISGTATFQRSGAITKDTF